MLVARNPGMSPSRALGRAAPFCSGSMHSDPGLYMSQHVRPGCSVVPGITWSQVHTYILAPGRSRSGTGELPGFTPPTSGVGSGCTRCRPDARADDVPRLRAANKTVSLFDA